MSIGAVGYSTDFYRAGYRKNSSNDSTSKFTTMGSATQETTSSNNGKTIGLTTEVSSRDLFREAVQKVRDDNQLTAQELKEEKDWREMTDEEWDEMLEGVDEYIDAFKERLRQLKEMQEEAAQKAALEADSDMRATAASSAALSAAANGLSGTSEADVEAEEGIPTEDGVKREKNWTKNLKTDDQTVLRTAKMAQEMEKKALSKFELDF